MCLDALAGVDVLDSDDFPFKRVQQLCLDGKFYIVSTPPSTLPPLSMFGIQSPPNSEVWVTDGKASFPTKPDGMKVAHLKKAIKEYVKIELANVDAPELIIKNADGAVLGDEDDLRHGEEYTYALPQ
jgi:hypothetical protein